MAEALNLAIIVVALLALYYLLKGRPKAPPLPVRPGTLEPRSTYGEADLDIPSFLRDR